MKQNKNKNGQAGNVLFVILIAIALLGLLTYAVSDASDQEIILDKVEIDSEVTRLFDYATLLAGVVQNMVVNGASPVALPAVLDPVVPDGTGWDTPPHRYKIYHPYGGGADVVSSTNDGKGANALAHGFAVVPAAVVKGVGPTDTTGDILFVARVSSAAYCQRINQKLYGTTTLPAVRDTVFEDLFVDATAQTLDDNTGGGGNSCADCINIARQCVQNASGDAWGYYQVLLAN